MIIEYAGTADRQVGTGTIHQVRAFWTAGKDDDGNVKRAAGKAVRDVVGKGGSVAFESWDMSTYSHPQLNAMIYVRVMTDAQVKRRAELKARRYTTCEGKNGTCAHQAPGEVVRVDDAGTELALCYGCRTALPKGSYQVVHWIKSDGRIQVN